MKDNSEDSHREKTPEKTEKTDTEKPISQSRLRNEDLRNLFLSSQKNFSGPISNSQ